MAHGNPKWYGRRYPTLEDLEAFAWDLGATVVYGDVPKGAFFPPLGGNPAVLAIPSCGGLHQIWSLVHELGHLVQHSGPKGELFWSKDEAAANRWAACALIPNARIRAHGNASQDAMIAAMSVHFEDIPFTNCSVRRLAARIARYRLEALRQEVA